MILALFIVESTSKTGLATREASLLTRELLIEHSRCYVVHSLLWGTAAHCASQVNSP